LKNGGAVYDWNDGYKEIRTRGICNPYRWLRVMQGKGIQQAKIILARKVEDGERINVSCRTRRCFWKAINCRT